MPRDQCLDSLGQRVGHRVEADRCRVALRAIGSRRGIHPDDLAAQGQRVHPFSRAQLHHDADPRFQGIRGQQSTTTRREVCQGRAARERSRLE